MLDTIMKTTDFLGQEWDINCMGCAVSDGSMSVPAGFILKTQHFCVHQDPLIPLPGFLVIASLRHYRSIADMHSAEYEEFCDLVRSTHAAIKQVTNVTNLTIVQEESSSHFHLWFFPWTPQVVENYGQPTLTKIREIMADHRKQPLSAAQWKELEEVIESIKSCWEN
jgi:diadenosine tetraphosphate (Ap4A) HIT family hydrolase